MIKESLEKDAECANASLDVREMVLLSVATSIDALAVGVTFAFLDVDIVPARVLYRRGHLYPVHGRA